MSRNRFLQSENPQPGKIGGWLSLAVTVILLSLFLMSVHSLGAASERETQKNLQRTILQSAVHCYATEGAYPESLDYLKKHYGVQYNSKKYTVYYMVFAANLLPEVTVIAVS